MAAKATDSFAANPARLDRLLEKRHAEGIGHSIGGKRVDGKAMFDTFSPVDKSQMAKVARGTANDIDRAAAAAKAGFKSGAAWDPASHICLAKGRHKIPKLGSKPHREDVDADDRS
jgi:5-carboxymethyl-2-hydroxymuconic-semialdehyde dehydrogenase